jgi:endoribonuclease Nob1
MSKDIFIIDTSAILSGRLPNLKEAMVATTPEVADELKPGGQDYRNFQYLKEKGLKIIKPEKKYVKEIKTNSEKLGEKNRVSEPDIELLALGLQLKNDKYNVIILTDDFSIQNIAEHLKIKYQNINQRRIKEKFKWETRCQGCGKKFKKDVDICPVCGTETKKVVGKKTKI